MQPATNHDAHYDQVLRDLVDMATDIARTIHAQITTRQQDAKAALPPTPSPANDQFPDPTLAFDRISRCIRRTILLAKKLPGLGDGLGREPNAENPTLRRIAARKRILRNVEDVIQRNARPEHLDPLHAELRERLDSPDLEDDIDHRPIQDIVADICRDLRVAIPYANNYKRRTPAQVADLRSKAAALPETWQVEKPRLPPENHSNTTAPPRRRSRPPNLYAVGYEEARNREGMD